ncbi:hypothetical protein BKA64DRAFT_720723 [Cadophora sp. MPI-SDFR-AT-0126]|nr:hypothetical protein BKA64DRAFT_720723 [Leotiomycetes sp. MPI-SDFR-AT-0126]
MTSLSTIYKLTGVLTPAMAAVLATPTAKTHEPSFFLCTGKNFTRYCPNLRAPSGVCGIVLPPKYVTIKDLTPASSHLYPTISMTRSLYLMGSAPECSIDELWFHWDNFPLPDLSVTPTHGPDGSIHNYEDQLSSVECWADDSV